MIEYKDYIIQPASIPSLYEIITSGRGSVIKDLRGLYTSVNHAIRDIEKHSKREEEKGTPKNGKAVSKTGV